MLRSLVLGMESSGGATLCSSVLLVVEAIESDRERVATSEVEHALEHLLLFLAGVVEQESPRLPLLDDLKELELVVRLENQLFDKTGRDLVLDSANLHVLIDDLHSEASSLSRQELVAVLIGQIVKLSEDHVIQFHQLHAGEGLDVQERDTSGEL